MKGENNLWSLDGVCTGLCEAAHYYPMSLIIRFIIFSIDWHWFILQIQVIFYLIHVVTFTFNSCLKSWLRYTLREHASSYIYLDTNSVTANEIKKRLSSYAQEQSQSIELLFELWHNNCHGLFAEILCEKKRQYILSWDKHEFMY